MTPTPKDEAKRLILSFYDIAENKYAPTNAMKFAEQAALLCVDEIIKCKPNTPYDYTHGETYNFWKQVKTEIENYQ